VSPLVWKGRLCLLACLRPASGGQPQDFSLIIRDVENGMDIARFGQGYGLASAFVHNDTIFVFASRFENADWNDVTLFKSNNLKTWESKRIIKQEGREHLFNSSVGQGPEGFVMAYESNDPAWPPFTIKFALSKDLENWSKVPEAIFGKKRYTACPTIRFINGFYYLLYLEQRTPRWFFETYIARSKDLRSWELSAANPVLTPDAVDDGINASDPDLVEFGGKTYLYYAVGDQLTWMNIKRAIFSGKMGAFLESWFKTPGIPDTK
jgi:alpha-L-fucosidase